MLLTLLADLLTLLTGVASFFAPFPPAAAASIFFSTPAFGLVLQHACLRVGI
jgi:hypothetical protein